MAASAYNATEIYAKELEDELMKYTRRDEQKKAELRFVEKLQLVNKSTEQVQSSKATDVNITECTKSVLFELIAATYNDTTEGSSSFDGCCSAEENDAPLNNFEAMSAFHDSAPTQSFDSFHDKLSLRKKELTEHWRSYIQPLIWRCRWAELQIKKLDSQARAYEKELKACVKERMLDGGSVLDNGVKSVPSSQINMTNHVLRRKKRRRVEEAADVGEYMSHHNLFAYFDNKKPPIDGPSKRNETKNPGKATLLVEKDIEFGLEDELLSTIRVDPDDPSETLLWKIFSLQSQVTTLKSRMGSVMSQNAGVFACLDDLIPSCASTPTSTGDGKEHAAEFVVPENSTSSHGDTDHDCMVVSKSSNEAASSQAKEAENGRGKRQSRRLRSAARIVAPTSSKRKRGRRRAVKRGRKS